MHRRWFLALALFSSVAAVCAAEAPGGSIVYSRKEGNGYVLHVMNGDGTGDHALAGPTGLVNLFPVWSRDGKQVAFLSGDTNPPQTHHVSIVGADGTGLRVVASSSGRSGLASWSPDGKQLTFTAGEPPAIHVSDTMGNADRQVNPPGTFAFASFWMPDGNRIGYTRSEEGTMKSKLVLAKPDGSNEEEVLSADGMVITGPSAISADGKRLAYLVMNPVDKKGQIHTWEFASKTDSLVSDLEIDGGDLDRVPVPCWSPDGKSILVPMKTEQGQGLFLISDDGKTRKRLTPPGVDCAAGSWLAGR